MIFPPTRLDSAHPMSGWAVAVSRLVPDDPPA